VVLVLFAALWAARVPQPDILVSADGRHVGVRGQDGRLHLMQAAKGSKDAFLVREWLAGDADARTGDDTTLGEGVSCDDNGCVTASAGGGLVAWSQRPEALADDCERAALIVTTRQAPAGCAASVIDAERLRRQGALALRRGPAGFVVDAVKPRGIDRPWSRAFAEEGETDNAVLAPRKPSPRAVDATPSDADLQSEE
jgi:competence protein ComEC